MRKILGRLTGYFRQLIDDVPLELFEPSQFVQISNLGRQLEPQP